MMDYLLNAVVTLFVTIDPVGLAPVFALLTAGFSPAQRRETAIRAAVIAGGVLVAFALVGERLIGFLGITMPAFRIAGGLLLFSIALEMVFGRRERRKSLTATSATSEDETHDLAAFPLAVPLTAGPGAISATILTASHSPGWIGMAALIIVIAGLIVVVLAVFFLAGEIERILGETGCVIVSRLLGVLLAALAVQFVADGVLVFARSAGTI